MKIIRIRQTGDWVSDSQHRMNRRVILLAVAAILIILFSVVNMRGLERQAAQLTTDYVQKLTDRMTKMTAMEMNSKQTMLASIGDSIVSMKRQNGVFNMQEYLSRKQQICGFDFMVYEKFSDQKQIASGKLPMSFTNGGRRFDDLQVTQRAKESLRGEISFESGNTVYAQPLYSGEVLEGFLWAGNSETTMQEIIQSKAFQAQSYSCVINKSGEVILSAADRKEFQRLDTIFIEGRDEDIRAGMNEMKNNIESGKGGVFAFSSIRGERLYLAYTPLGFYDWTMLTIVPTDLLSSSFDDFVYRAQFCVVGALLFFVAMIASLLRFYSGLAFSDEVTGGMNNRNFQRRWREMSKMDASRCAVVLMDVADFRQVNRKFGMERGNDVLKHIYRVLAECLNKGEFVARSEVDRFFLCLRERNPQKIQERVDHLIKNINQTMERSKLPQHRIRFRIGVSMVQDSSLGIIELQNRARTVMKNNGRNRDVCTVYTPSLEARVQKEREMMELFDAALEHEDFQIYFQPKVSLNRERVSGAEALIRWRHPDGTIVMPGEFIPILEENGKICLLDRYVFERVCRWIKKREQEHLPRLIVSVNLSRNHFLDENFVEWFVDTATFYEIDRSQIEFELTESIFMDEGGLRRIRKQMDRIHEEGFRLSIDDFGVGYSSLSLIREVDVDVLKVDRSFFRDLKDSRSRAVLSCLMKLAAELRIDTVVEGIETADQIARVRELGCDVVQGYFFSRPLPVSEFEAWCESFDFDDFRG